MGPIGPHGSHRSHRSYGWWRPAPWLEASLQELFDFVRKQLGALARFRRVEPDAIVEFRQFRTGSINISLSRKLGDKPNQKIAADHPQFIFQVETIGLEGLYFDQAKLAVFPFGNGLENFGNHLSELDRVFKGLPVGKRRNPENRER